MTTTDPRKQDQVKVYIVDHTTTGKERRELNDLFSVIGTPYEPGTKFVPPMRVEPIFSEVSNDISIVATRTGVPG